MQPVISSETERAEAFRQSEASVRLEGFEPTSDPRYLELKRRVLSGEISSQEAGIALLAPYTVAHTTAA